MPVNVYTTFDNPLNTSGDGTLASGINDTGQIVGTYADAGGVHGFLLSGGSYSTLDAPLAQQYTAARKASTAQVRSSVFTSATPACRAACTASCTTKAFTPPSTIPCAPTAPLQLASTTRATSSGITGTAPATSTAFS